MKEITYLNWIIHVLMNEELDNPVSVFDNLSNYTNREIIILILSDKSEQRTLINKETLKTKYLLSTDKAAQKLGISTTSLIELADKGLVNAVDIDDEKYFSLDVKLPNEQGDKK